MPELSATSDLVYETGFTVVIPLSCTRADVQSDARNHEVQPSVNNQVRSLRIAAAIFCASVTSFPIVAESIAADSAAADAYQRADVNQKAAIRSARQAYRTHGLVANVREFGAIGDGKTNDTEAFQQAAKKIQDAGGGTILIPPGIYLVGRQQPAERRGMGYLYRGEDIVALRDCTLPVRIIGPKATMKLVPGLKYGSFDPRDGTPHEPQHMPFLERDYLATIGSMISIERCADVQIAGLELDGNSTSLQLGGQWGDTGWQVPAIGIYASSNGRLGIHDVSLHHHALDGIQIGHPGLTLADVERPHTLYGVSSEHNGLQGLSWVGGNSLTVIRSRFNHNGKGRISSSPGAGIDVEAENSICRNSGGIRDVVQYAKAVSEIRRRISEWNRVDGGLMKSHVGKLEKIPSRDVEGASGGIDTVKVSYPGSCQARPSAAPATKVEADRTLRQCLPGKLREVAFENTLEFELIAIRLIESSPFVAKSRDNIFVNVLQQDLLTEPPAHSGKPYERVQHCLFRIRPAPPYVKRRLRPTATVLPIRAADWML